MSHQHTTARRPGTRERLGLTLKFTDPAVIAANQRGYLTPEQVSVLAQKVYKSNGCALVAVPGVFLVLLGGTLIGLSVQGQPVTTPIPYLVSLGLFVLIVIGVIRQGQSEAARVRFQRSAASGDIPLIDRAQGEIVWDLKQKRYHLHTPGHDTLTLSALLGDVFHFTLTSYLLPGPYHFYFVKDWKKRRELLISAQPIRTNTEMLGLPGTLAATGLPGDAQACLAVQHALCLALDFSPTDLEANQQGVVAPGQIGKLPRQFVRQSNLQVRRDTGDIRVARELVPGDNGPDSYAYFFELAGRRFPIPSVAPAALGGRGIRYSIYSLEGTSILLSVEPLPFQR